MARYTVARWFSSGDHDSTTILSPPRAFRLAKHILLHAVLLAAFLLRFYALDASSLWSDEGNTWALLSRSFSQIARDAAVDIHPPGYYWLLKLWTGVVGANAFAMRSFSALVGVLLVAVTYRIGWQLETMLLRRADQSAPPAISLCGLAAATIAALNAFQVYYSQEARMYMLLALEGALFFWALLALIGAEQSPHRPGAFWWPAIMYVVSGSAGLWTHYSFPALWAAAIGVYLLQWGGCRWQLRRDSAAGRTHGQFGCALSSLLRFSLLNGLILLSFAPWLPTAIRRVLQWPAGGEEIAFVAGLRLTLHTLLFGPLRTLSEPHWGWLLVAGILPLLGGGAAVVALGRNRKKDTAADLAQAVPATPLAVGAAATPIAWLFMPVVLMFSLGLFSEAFLKFLLTASPAWCLLVALVPWLLAPPVWRHVALLGVLGVAVAAAWIALPDYYADPHARDNYAGVARYIRAQPAHLQPDLVVLNAPGQREVWAYYDPGVPLLALPRSRPPDREQTIRTLESAIADRASTAAADAAQSLFRIIALFWATDESDPDRIVETWLDQHAFKAVESWQGNVRFASYVMPGELSCAPFEPPPVFGERIQLRVACQPHRPQTVLPGDAAIVALHWRALDVLDTSHAVTVQLLDARNQVIAQRDGLPGGGSQPTTSWQPGTDIVDNHGIPIPFGTPPGTYRLIAALYDPATGARLPVRVPVRHADADADHVEIGTVEVVRAAGEAPIEIVPMGHRLDAPVGPVRLVGYNAHRKGSAHAPQTPVQPGELVHFTFYWQAPDPLPVDWPADLSFSLRLGEQTITASLAGGAYPTGAWQSGELVRGEFDIPFDGRSRIPRLRIGETELRLAAIPQQPQ